MKIGPHRRAGMLLTKAASLFSSTNSEVLGRFGLTPVSWGVLHRILHTPGQSTHALAEMCLQTDQSLGQIVVKLAKQGLVQRTPTFGRAIIHEITDKGRGVLAEVEPLMDKSIRDFFAELDKNELTALSDLLERVVMSRGNERLKQSIVEFNKSAKE